MDTLLKAFVIIWQPENGWITDPISGEQSYHTHDAYYILNRNTNVAYFYGYEKPDLEYSTPEDDWWLLHHEAEARARAHSRAIHSCDDLPF